MTLVFYRKRAFKRKCVGARCSGALSIKPLEGSRPWLRRTRALCKFNGGKVRCRGTPGLCGEAQKTTPQARELAGARNDRERSLWRNRKKRLVRRQDAEGRSVAKHAKFSGCGRRFHAATVTRTGGERSWIWAAVSLSMTTMGPPHLGQSQSGVGSLAREASDSVCDGCTALST